MEEWIARIAIGVILLVLGYFIKRSLMSSEERLMVEIKYIKNKQNEINGSVKDVIEKHHLCREELPKVYATKDTVSKLFDEIKPIRLDIGLIKREISKREREIAQQT